MSYGYRHDTEDEHPLVRRAWHRRSFSQWLGDQWMDWIWPLVKFVILAGLVIWGMVSCANSQWYQNDQRRTHEQEQRDATPHVIREADGCKVYAFTAGGRWHYFTRCPGSSTKTDSTYEVRQSKTTRTETESIETQ